MLFVTPGHGKATLGAFAAFMRILKDQPGWILKVVCDMSSAFLSAVPKQLPNAKITVDWFHIVQIFTRALGDERKGEKRIKPLPTNLRWAALKIGKTARPITHQLKVLAEFCWRSVWIRQRAWRIKERLRWLRLACTRLAAHPVHQLPAGSDQREPAAQTNWPSAQHTGNASRMGLRRWTSTYTNARLEGLNRLLRRPTQELADTATSIP